MRGPKSTPITLSPMHRALLQRLARRHTTSQQLVKRVRIILEADSGACNWDIARQLGIDRGTVGVWRKRGWSLHLALRLHSKRVRMNGSC